MDDDDIDLHYMMRSDTILKAVFVPPFTKTSELPIVKGNLSL